ncbi:Glycosyltransferase, GT2 family [Azotobacter beijerinckii]|uniref:Glycosyltransferase, GT2 family n=1 Tax=Azotobacter beijerinckii TaxID=170623 RepID=A0A1H6ZEQ0_9GAMM|nr:glycosyltransferase family 2 protein [Azotobacter beijerinckii]SEJ48020.1 Glycosyltransferase, GT2 family [Azotobacter beijerinckii]
MPPSLSAQIQSHFKKGDIESAQAALALALQTPGYRNEALIWQGVAALREGRQADAFLHLARASERLPQRTDLKLLLGRSLQQSGQHEPAEGFLRAALQRFPADQPLRRLYWSTLQTSRSHAEIAAQIRAQLADIRDPTELQQVLQILADEPATELLVGVVRYDAARNLVTGWAVDLKTPERPPRFQLATGQVRLECLANTPSPLLTQAGFPATHGGILVRPPQPSGALRVIFTTGAELIGSPLAAVAPFTPPPPSEQDPFRQPVDILVPVFKGVDITLACLDSLLRHKRDNRTPHRIVVLDDACPEPQLVQAIENLARRGRIELVRRPANLGFIRNMNRGMALHPERDVVWLNADTRVHGDWLDRLRAVAYQAEDIASVTPFTNNGELMSFPESRIAHPMPDPQAHARLDRAARQSGCTPVELEVGCGFCFYIKRRALDAVGYLDEETLQRGYGEETDWCLRARRLGWRHLGATNVFVAHSGGHSFGPEKALRVHQNNAILRRRYPDAERRFDTFVARDPLRPAREALQQLLAAQERPTEAPTPPPTPLTASRPPLPGRCWLIADRLDRAEIGERWLRLARHLARQQPAITLLLAEDTPWETQLLATDGVSRLPRIDGLDARQTLELCGTVLALSLDATPETVTHSPYHVLQAAQRHRLPLFAPESAGLDRLGAFGLHELHPYLPKEVQV